MSRAITITVPDHTATKLDALQAHYEIPLELLAQEYLVDRVDQIHDIVVLEPARKKAQA